MDIHALGNCAAGTVVWRHQGKLRLTVVTKACFTFDGAGVLTRCETPPFASRDLHVNNQPLASVEQPTDRVPKRLLDEVVLIGAARPLGGKPVASMPVRLALHRGEQLLIDKRLQVVGDQHDGQARPFEHMPLGYERSYGGVGIRDNPIGRVLPDGGGNVRYPQQPAHVAGFGPFGVAWLARAPLREGAKGIELDDAGARGVMELPDAFDFRFFQCAPSDQHVAGLTIGDRVVMEGFFADAAQIAFDVPDCEAAGVVFGADGEGGDDSARRLLLNLDLLHIHTERRTVTLSWRGSLPLADEAALAGVAVAAGVFEAGVVPALPSRRADLAVLPVADAVAAVAVSTLSDVDLQTLAPVASRTLPIRPRSGEDAPASASAAPFPLAEGEQPASSKSIPDAPWSRTPSDPVLPPVQGADQTLDPFRPPEMPSGAVARMADHASAVLKPWQGAGGAPDGATLSPQAAQALAAQVALMGPGVPAGQGSLAEQGANSTLPIGATGPRGARSPADDNTPLQQAMMQSTAPVRSTPSQSQRVPGAPWSQEQASEVAPPSADQAATLDIFAHQALAASNEAPASAASAEPVSAAAPADSAAAASAEPAAPTSGASPEPPAATPSAPSASAAETRDGGEATEPRWAPIDKVSKTPAPQPAPRRLNINNLLYSRKKR